MSVPDIIKILITPAALIIGALVGTWRTGLDPRSGLGLQRPSARHALMFTVVFIVLLGLHEGAYQLSGMGERETDWRTYETGALVMRVMFVGLIYPVAEELFFRGLVLGLVTRKAGAVAGVAASALFFTALHDPYNGWIGPLLVFTDGVYFGFVRLRSGSLLLPVAFHVMGNSIAIVQRLY
jgi:uncharacterized protein